MDPGQPGRASPSGHKVQCIVKVYCCEVVRGVMVASNTDIFTYSFIDSLHDRIPRIYFMLVVVYMVQYITL